MKYEIASRTLDINDKIQSFKKQLPKKCNADICPKSLPVCLIFCIFVILMHIIFPQAGSTNTRQQYIVGKKKQEGDFVN